MSRVKVYAQLTVALLLSARAGVAQEAVSVSAGEFTRVDRSHWASGTATVVQMADGGGLYVVFEEGFRSAAGPDLRVVLSPGPDPKRGSDLGEYTELGLLSETNGAQSYEIPADLSGESIGSVVIYCKRFDVIFSTARLEPTGEGASADDAEGSEG